ncbi:MAG: PEP-CTERM sorting domain-containing protein [Fibrobacteres bacterium]|nr:PEP-CTERM sorting domain-containing protein [Fibrobacterota bacterium]
MKKPFQFFLLGIISIVSVSKSLAVPVLNSSNLYTISSDAAVGSTVQSTSLTSGAAAISSDLGTVSESTQGTVSSSANSLTMNYAFSEHLDAPHPTLVSYYDYWYGYVSFLSGDMYSQSLVNGTFTLDAADVGYTYSMTADFDQTGTSQMVLFASLYDITEYGALYDDFQFTNGSTDGSMGLGTGAQSFNYPTVGATSGDLIAGHTYGYSMSSYIRHWQAADGETATDAQGTFAMNIQGPAPEAVPEPSSLALLGLGACGIIFAARKRTSSRA